MQKNIKREVESVISDLQMASTILEAKGEIPDSKRWLIIDYIIKSKNLIEKLVKEVKVNESARRG